VIELNMKYITGCTCISCMPLTVTVSTIAGCLRTDYNILGDNNNNNNNNNNNKLGNLRRAQ